MYTYHQELDSANDGLVRLDAGATVCCCAITECLDDGAANVSCASGLCRLVACAVDFADSQQLQLQCQYCSVPGEHDDEVVGQQDGAQQAEFAQARDARLGAQGKHCDFHDAVSGDGQGNGIDCTDNGLSDLLLGQRRLFAELKHSFGKLEMTLKPNGNR